MISPLYSLFFFLFFLKDAITIRSVLSLGYPFIFLIFLFPLLYFLISSCIFNCSSSSEKFFFWILITSFFFLLLFRFASNNPFVFLFFLETCVVLNIFFLFNFSKDSDKISSVFFIIFFNIVGSIPFFWFCTFYDNVLLVDTSDSHFLIFCFLVILCSKLPIFIIHFWLTKAHVRARGSGSIVLASLMLKIGSVGLAKWSFLFSFLFLEVLSCFFFSLMLGGSILFLIVIVRYFDLKYLVACSSVVHIGILIPLFLHRSKISFFSSSIIIVRHSLVSCLIFYLVTILYEVCYERSIRTRKRLESFRTSFSLVIFFWFLLNLGFPPFLRFMRELFFFFFFLSFDFYCTILFFIVLILSGLVFFRVISAFLYSKKIQYTWEKPSIYVFIGTLLYVLLFLLICFFL